jgi:hypothetical protein
MVNAFLVVGILYIALATIFQVVRKQVLDKLIRVSTNRTKYGAFDAEILEKESGRYFEFISLVIGMGGVAFSILGQFDSAFSNVPVALLVSLAPMPFFYLVGFRTQVMNHGLIQGVYPTGSAGVLAVASIFSWVMSPLVALLAWISGVLIFDGDILIDGFIVIPFVVGFALMFLFVLGEWLFGQNSLIQTLPYSLKRGPFVTMFPISLFFSWTLVVGHDLLLLSVGAVACAALGLYLTHKASDDNGFG